MAGQTPCGQPGCSRLFTQNAECIKHIQNHHLSRLNIQLITAQPHSSSLLPRRTTPSSSSSPRNMDNLDDPDNHPYPNQNEIPISFDHHNIPMSPNCELPMSPNHNKLPMSPDPIDCPTPDPDPPPP